MSLTRCAEQFIRTRNENLVRVRHFEIIEEFRQVLLAFRELYNTKWPIDRNGYLSPAEFRVHLHFTAQAA